ncbi:ImmA/IrrE family metallo-endopeptidase [Actinomyces naeslundii]|uniref:ImmA/IrrE family metallo-endopeptidase n=1 Tax=Actinomyces naeslundii TaxID=1655 RepID=UPI002092279D|nr:ImmA/IrrE family metallo-endopeptidase [Actinomyces naeslundii]
MRGLLQFFGISSMDAFQATWNQGAVAYRRSAVGRDNTNHLATWLRAAERSYELDDLPDYNRSKLEETLPELRALTVADPVQAILKAQTLLRECGVALALVPAVPGLGIHGATRWIQEHPLIQLSDLWKCDDQLWFTLFHEIAHVLLHESNGLYLNDDHDALEKEANAYAAHLLVPEAYEGRLPRRRNLDEVRALAEELGIAPSIVLGQAQHRTGDYAWGHSLKRKVTITSLAA